MEYDGLGVKPAEIAQKARDLQTKLYEERAYARRVAEEQLMVTPGILYSPMADFDELVNVVTALAETTQWMCEQLPEPLEVVEFVRIKEE